MLPTLPTKGFRTQSPSFCEVRRDEREGRQKAGFSDDDCCFDVDQKLVLGEWRPTNACLQKEEEKGRVWPWRGLREPNSGPPLLQSEWWGGPALCDRRWNLTNEVRWEDLRWDRRRLVAWALVWFWFKLLCVLRIQEVAKAFFLGGKGCRKDGFDDRGSTNKKSSRSQSDTKSESGERKLSRWFSWASKRELRLPRIAQNLFASGIWGTGRSPRGHSPSSKLLVETDLSSSWFS